MRIAIVVNTSWNIYNFRMGLIKKLIEEGNEVHTIAPRDPFSEKLINLGCVHHDLKMDSRGANPIKDSALVLELLMTYKKVKPDIILHFTIKPNIYGSIAAAILNIPVVNNICGLGTVFLKKNLLSKVAELLYRISFRTPKKVYFQNPCDQKLFIDKNLINKQITDIIPGSGINLNHFPAIPYSRNNEFTFLMISRLIYDKGVTEYIEAIRYLKAEGVNARFQMLGAIDEEHQRGIKASIINEWINEGIIEYLGTTEDVRSYIANADCIVLPSYREGTPRTLLEAASSAKPIIATNVPGCNNVVKDGYNGLLCNLKDAEDLANKMKELLRKDNNYVEQLGKNGRLKVEKEFNENFVIDSYMQTVAQLLPLRPAV